MPKLKLTATAIAKLKAPDPSGKQQLHWDSELTGFAVLCSGVSIAKSYIVQRDIGGKARRITIAPCNVLDLDKARVKAKLVLAQFYEGKNPKAHLRGDAKATLQMVLEDFLTTRKDLREATRTGYRNFVEGYLASWLDRPMVNITVDEVTDRHVAIQVEVAARGTELATGATSQGCDRRL
jgi:Arm DNA-binding domain